MGLANAKVLQEAQPSPHGLRKVDLEPRTCQTSAYQSEWSDNAEQKSRTADPTSGDRQRQHELKSNAGPWPATS